MIHSHSVVWAILIQALYVVRQIQFAPGTRAPSTKEESWRLSSLREKKKNDLEKQRNQAKDPHLMKTGFSTVALLILPDSSLLWGVVLCIVECIAASLVSSNLTAQY